MKVRAADIENLNQAAQNLYTAAGEMDAAEKNANSEVGDANQCAELVDGSNSDTCGDYIEDTPADPHLNFNVNPITCQWLGTGIDANGDNYAPDTRLIMSYTDIRHSADRRRCCVRRELGVANLFLFSKDAVPRRFSPP